MMPDGPDPIEWKADRDSCFSAGASLAVDYNGEHVHDPYDCLTFLLFTVVSQACSCPPKTNLSFSTDTCHPPS